MKLGDNKLSEISQSKNKYCMTPLTWDIPSGAKSESVSHSVLSVTPCTAAHQTPLSNGKESACQSRRRKRCVFNPWVGKIPWRRKWQLTLVFLPGKFHGQRSMAGYSPWGPKRARHYWVTEYTHHLYELFKAVRLTETENRLVVVRGWEWEEVRSCLMGIEFQSCIVKKF